MVGDSERSFRFRHISKIQAKIVSTNEQKQRSYPSAILTSCAPPKVNTVQYVVTKMLCVVRSICRYKDVMCYVLHVYK